MVLRRKDGYFESRVKRIPDRFSINVNEEDKKLIAKCQYILEQPKHSTCVKQLIEIASKVLFDNLTQEIITTIFENKRKNKRTGYDAEFE